MVLTEFEIGKMKQAITKEKKQLAQQKRKAINAVIPTN